VGASPPFPLPPRDVSTHASAISERLAALRLAQAALMEVAAAKPSSTHMHVQDLMDIGREMETRVAAEAAETQRARGDPVEARWHTQAATAVTATSGGESGRSPALAAWLQADHPPLPASQQAGGAGAWTGAGVGSSGGGAPEVSVYERMWGETYDDALGASKYARRNGKSVPGGAHGPAALHLLVRRAQLSAVVAGACSTAIPAVAYFSLYRGYPRLWPVSFSGLFISLAMAALGLFAAETRSPRALAAYVVTCPLATVAQAMYGVSVAAHVDWSCRRAQFAVVGCGTCPCALGSTCQKWRTFAAEGCPACRAWDATVCAKFRNHLATWGVLASLVALLAAVVPTAAAAVLLLRLENARGLAQSQAEWAAGQLRAQCRRLRAGHAPHFHGARVAAQSAALFRRLATAAATHNPRLAAVAEVLLRAWERHGGYKLSALGGDDRGKEGGDDDARRGMDVRATPATHSLRQTAAAAAVAAAAV